MFIRAAEHSTLLFGIFGDYRMFSMVLKISELFNTIMNNNSSIKKRSGRIFSNNNEKKSPNFIRTKDRHRITCVLARRMEMH